MGFRFDNCSRDRVPIRKRKTYNKQDTKCSKFSKRSNVVQLTQKNKQFLKSLGYQLR